MFLVGLLVICGLFILLRQREQKRVALTSRTLQQVVMADLEPETRRSNGDVSEMKTVVSQSEVVAKVRKDGQLTRKESMSESGSLSATKLNTDGWVGAMTVNNEANEGLDKYAEIERVLKAVDPDDYVYYLNN